MKNSFLIWGIFKEDFYQGIDFIVSVSKLFLLEKVAFELEIKESSNTFYIKNSNEGI